MSEPRIKAGIWVSMALRMGNADGRHGVVLRKGDADAGGIIVVLRRRDAIVRSRHRVYAAARSRSSARR